MWAGLIQAFEETGVGCYLAWVNAIEHGAAVISDVGALVAREFPHQTLFRKHTIAMEYGTQLQISKGPYFRSEYR